MGFPVKTGLTIGPGASQPAPEPLRPDFSRGVKVESAASALSDPAKRDESRGDVNRPEQRSPLSHRDELHHGRIGAARRERICSRCGRSIMVDRFESAAVIAACCSCIGVAGYLLWIVVSM